MAVNYEQRGNVRVFTLDRPEARNAVNHDVSSEMESHLDAFEADDTAWVGVLAANGPVFSAGADLKAVSSGKSIETERGGFAGQFGTRAPNPYRSRRRSRISRGVRNRPSV